MKKDATFYLKKVSEVLEVLKGDEPVNQMECNIVIGMVAARLVEYFETCGECRRKAIDELCKSVRAFCE